MKKILIGLIFSALMGSTALSQLPEDTQQAQAYYHFTRAMAFESTGQWEDALAEFEKALAIDPTNSMIYSEMAASFLRRRQVDQGLEYAQRAVRADRDNLLAHQLLSSIYTSMLSQTETGNLPPELLKNTIEEFEHIVRLDKNEREAYLMLGRLYRFNNDPERATAVYRDYLEIAPGSEEGAISLAELQINAGNVEEAIEILKKFNLEQPGSQMAMTILGDAYSRVESFEEAANSYNEAIALDEDNVDVLLSLAQALFFADRLEEAAKRYLQLIEKNSKDAFAHLRLGQIYRGQMKFEEARNYLTAASQLIPDSVEIRFNLALANRDSGLFEEALSQVQELLRQTERPNDRYTQEERLNRGVFLTHVAMLNSLMQRNNNGTVDSYIADMYRSAKELDRALAHNRAALLEFPDNRQLLLQNADLMAEKGYVKEGLEALQEMTANDTHDLQIFSSMIAIHQREKDFESAQQILNLAMERFSEDEQVHFLQGTIYERQQNYERAEKAFRTALEIEADEPAVLNYLGYMLADNSIKLDEALAMIQKAVKANPVNGAYLDSLGWVHYRLGNMEMAERYLKRALLFSYGDPTIHEHMGDLYKKTGRLMEAISEYEKSIKMEEDEEQRKKVQKKLNILGSGNDPN